MKLGVFGGTFDPPHVGHLIVAEEVAAALNLDRVLFIPAGSHPLKGSGVEASGRLRLQMVESAIAGSELFAVDDREIRRSGPSYTAETLAELKAEQPEAELFLIVGADILGELHLWHRSEEVARLARLTVMSRSGLDDGAVAAVDAEYLKVNVTHIGISSTEIRQRIKAGRPYRYLVPSSVYRLIADHGLYAG